MKLRWKILRAGRRSFWSGMKAGTVLKNSWFTYIIEKDDFVSLEKVKEELKK
jgi:hypothetical protein